MPQNSRLNLTSKKEQGVDVSSMISAPLVAASKANTDMLRHQAYFLMEFCFTKVSPDNINADVKDPKDIKANQYKPRMVEMFMKKSIIKHDEDGNPVFHTEEFSFQVPVLTLIPINSLAVDDIKLEFDMEITSQTTHTIQSEQNGGHPAEERAQLRGKISYDSKEKGNSERRSSSKLKVNVHAGPLPLPVGVTAIIEMYTKAILPIPNDDDQ